MKPYIAFTNTDVTRLYNSAETKTLVINYLLEHELIKKIDNLFLSTNATKKTFKPEIGYLKLFPVLMSASETTSFDMKLRELVAITFDDYYNNILNIENSLLTSSEMNNTFNPSSHNWLFNREWCTRLKNGDISEYYHEKIICPDSKMSVIIINMASVANDEGNETFDVLLVFMLYLVFVFIVRDLFDRPRSKLTASQRTNKELQRLGVKRQRASDDQPISKRQRKPKRFADEDL